VLRDTHHISHKTWPCSAYLMATWYISGFKKSMHSEYGENRTFVLRQLRSVIQYLSPLLNHRLDRFSNLLHLSLHCIAMHWRSSSFVEIRK
jgi:hypothetical protein